MRFDIEQAVEAANRAIATIHGRSLTDIEILVLKGAWERESYDQIAARGQYATSYISQDIAPKLWKLLSDALGEKIKKNSFKQSLQRYWEVHIQPASPYPPGQPPKGPSSGHWPIATQSLDAPLNPDADTRPYASYIHRPDIEQVCFKALLHPGSLIRIKSPKLTGKTSLINCVLKRLSIQGMHTLNLSLRMADSQHHFGDIDNFLKWLCFNVEQELSLESQLHRYWNAEWLGSKVSCTTYFEKYLLTHDDLPVVLCLDDIDLLFSYPHLYEDFFGLLRSWYEKARSRPQWEKLRLILSHSTEAYIRLTINQSPFNVGIPVDLDHFTPPQVNQLVQQMGLTYSPEAIRPLTTLIGGHPYLLEKALSYLRATPNLSLADFIASAPTQAGIYRNHLQDIWHQLKEHPELEAAYWPVVNADQPVLVEPTQAYKLQSMGLIKLTGNLAESTCQLYRQYFLANLKAGEAKG